MAAARWSVQPGIQRSGVVAVVGKARTPAMASVAGRCPACGVHHPVPSSGVRRSSPPVSGRLASSASGVQPVRCPPVRCPPVRCPPVRWSAGGCPPPSVRTRPSHPTSDGGVVDQVGAAGNPHHRNGSSPGGLLRRGAARSTAEQARTRATLPGSRVGQVVGGGPGPGWVRAAAALDRWGTRQGWPACGALSLTAALWARGRLRREVAAAAAWLPLLGWGGVDHGGW